MSFDDLLKELSTISSEINREQRFICSIFLVMEYCEQDLASLLDNMTTPFTEAQVASSLRARICLRVCLEWSRLCLNPSLFFGHWFLGQVYYGASTQRPTLYAFQLCHTSRLESLKSIINWKWLRQNRYGLLSPLPSPSFGYEAVGMPRLKLKFSHRRFLPFRSFIRYLRKFCS